MAIIGAGATGVELAAELHHAGRLLAAYGLDGIRPENLRLTLIEAGPRVLPALPERISGPVHETLEKLGVTVLTGSPVSEVTAEACAPPRASVVPASLKVWAAGIRAPALPEPDWTAWKATASTSWWSCPTLQTTPRRQHLRLRRLRSLPAGGRQATCRRAPRRRTSRPRCWPSALKRRLEGQPLLEYRYRDYGSLISLSRFSGGGQPDGQPDRRA